MQFSNLLIVPLITEPLKYYFSTYTKSSNLYWDPDEKKCTIEIGDTFDYEKIPLGENPRVLVDRGPYSITKVGLTDNMAEGRSMRDTNGLKDNINMLMYSGSATITIEARKKGTCELLADMVSHFVAWTRPFICDTQGFKEFGLGMGISSCVPGSESTPGDPKFQIIIQLPWIKEEHWRTRDDSVALKSVLLNIGL